MKFEKVPGHFERDELGRFKKGTAPGKKIKKRSGGQKFDSLDNPTKSYWFGFLAGDGSIGVYKNNRHRLKLSIKDKEHLKKFMSFLGYKDSKIYGSGPIHEFKVDNKEIVQNLFDLGLKQNKVKKNSGELIPDNFKRDFIRGLFDADGSVNFFKPSNGEMKNAEFHISGTKELLKAVKDIIAHEIKEITSKNGSLVQGKGCFCLEYKGRFLVEKIGHYLYSNAAEFLERKFNVFRELFNYNKRNSRKQNRFDKKDIDRIKKLYWKEKFTQKEIAEKNGISRSHVSRIINEKRYSQHKNPFTREKGVKINDLKYPKETYLRALELKKKGLGYKRIGKIINVSPWTVREWINRDNLPKQIKRLIKKQKNRGD